MNKKQKKVLYRILVSGSLLVIYRFLSPEGIWAILAYLLPYGIIGYDILRKAALGIFHGEVFDENFLMAVATLGAFFLGEYGEGAAVMLFYQVGELFQSYAVGKSRKNITALMDIRPDYANIRLENGEMLQVDPDEVEVGSLIYVKPGEKIPMDGIVEEGRSSLNTSALTGESLPREVTVGQEVISGCINMTGLLTIKTTKDFEQSTVSKILELVENSSMKKARSEKFITRFAHYYTPAVCYMALALAVLPPLISLWLGGEAGWSMWVTRALTFLVISCPCALVISIPLSFFGGIGGAGASGILIKGSNYLEALARTKYVVFDKTGTLTKGTFEVTDIITAGEGEEKYSKQEILEYAAYAECYLTHPIAKSLKAAYGKEILEERVTDIEEIAGYGVKATVDGRKIHVGNQRLMEKLGISCPEISEVGSYVHLAVEGEYTGCIVISDRVKETSQSALSLLKRAGIRTVMLTGDSQRAAGQVAAALGISDVYSELLPADKVTRVEELLSQKKPGEVLAFVGDGVNDAPVLSRADIGIAMGAMGSDAAIEAADIVLMDDNPQKIALAMKISRKCMTIVYENIVFALAVKGICLILGAMGIANMWLAIFADVGVMVLAVMNAIRCLNVTKE